MKRLISIFLVCSLLLSACAAPTESTQTSNASDEIKKEKQTLDSEALNNKDNPEDVRNDDGDEPNEKLEQTEPEKDGISNELDISVKGLDDEQLLEYVENNVYQDLVKNLDSEEYFVENVDVIYYPKEYVEALGSNTRPNLYFGYTSDELDNIFHGTRYVFTLGQNGRTTVIPMETVSDNTYVKTMENVIIGTGVILVCVTISTVTGPLGAGAAVHMIFAASSATGTQFALESGAISFAAAAIAKGYETESFDQALKAGAQAGSEGFKWGAIIGASVAGVKEAAALKGATLNGLTMNEAARIQKESGYPLELIKQFKSYKEYEIYKGAGLYTKMVNGKLALVRNIDLEYVSELPNGEKVTNLIRMQKGYAPIDPVTGKAYQLHHINQNPNGTLAILTETEHQGNASILNLFGKESEIDRKAFNKIREEFWKKFAAGLV